MFVCIWQSISSKREMGVEERGEGTQRVQHIIILLFFLSGEWHDGWRGCSCVDALRTQSLAEDGDDTLFFLSSQILSSELTVFWDIVKEENESFGVSLGSQIFMTPLNE